MQLTLPPLRDRGKDIISLAENLLQRFCEQMAKNTLALTPESIQAITTYTWPGNVRELENAMQRAVILCEDEHEISHDLLAIDLDLVQISDDKTEILQQIQRTQNTSSTSPLSASPEPNEDLSLEDYFQRFVLEHQDTMSETELARKLGVSRKCLWERRQRLGIPRKKTAAGAK